VPCKNFSVQWKFSSRWVSGDNIQEKRCNKEDSIRVVPTIYNGETITLKSKMREEFIKSRIPVQHEETFSRVTRTI